ncbi:MAG: aminotransferase class I/II-fold pyridoxal phosphate-dependent enzyme [Flavobacteriales bacterium]|nr:aminotransferase class I/II-fold pyridoxal phosphate-dependent enzyme [Flavobacteriales bacterium]
MNTAHRVPPLHDKLPEVGTTIFTVMSRLAQEVGAINLSQGFPDHPIDPAMIDLVDRAMRDGHNQYAPMPGLPALRSALVDKAAKLYGYNYDAETEVTVTAGATQALFTTIAALVSVGDEVIIIDPAYDCYAPAVRLFGGVPVHVPLTASMTIDLEALRAAFGPRTRALIINTPHNPAGTILHASDMQAIAELLRDSDAVLISDEVYEHMVFDGAAHQSAIRYPELRERAFVVFSFGKVFHATGWKVGYVFAPEKLMTLFRKVHQFNVFSVNTPVQHAFAHYLADPAHYDGLSAFFQAKRDHFAQGMKHSRFRLLPCQGSYFQLADYSAISDEGDLAFAERLAREHGVASIPLSPFYHRPPADQRILRFCFAKQVSTLDAAIERLCRI